MTVINTNIKALYAQIALKSTGNDLSTAMEQLSSGKRINSAKDDAAGLAIATRMTQQVRSLNQAVRNAGDAIGMVQTAEGATNAISEMLQRMRELAIQAINDTNSDDQRSYLDLEFQQLKQEIVHISTSTEWNGFPLLNGTAGTPEDDGENADGVPYLAGKLTFHVGGNAGDVITIVLPDFGSEGSITGDVTNDVENGAFVNLLDITTAKEALPLLNNSMDQLNRARANMGSVMNRLQYVIDNLMNVSMNTEASRSRIEDADYAAASTELAKTQIMQQAATAVLAQANTSQQTVLKLLQG